MVCLLSSRYTACILFGRCPYYSALIIADSTLFHMCGMRQVTDDMHSPDALRMSGLCVVFCRGGGFGSAWQMRGCVR